MESPKKHVLQELVREILELDNATERVVAMKYTASTDTTNEASYAAYSVLYALAREIGTNDPLSDTNLRGICANKERLRKVLAELLQN